MAIVVMIADCSGCEVGDHEKHRRVVQAVPEGVMGGIICTCEGECVRDAAGRRERYLSRLGLTPAVRAAMRGSSLAPYPTMSQAAKMLDVAPSTLSRRTDVVTHARGDRDTVLLPAEVLRLGQVYRKRSINEVAADLIDHAAQHGERIEAEVDAFFEAEND